MTSVAIIGGGITGLTAGFRLRQQGIPVTVYEASGRVGGVIQSIRQDGYLAEFGPNTCLETSPKITQLIRDLGLESRKLYTDPAAENRYIVRGGKPVLMPGSPIGFFKTPLFSINAKARLVAEPFIRRAPADIEENLEQFVLRRLGREFLDYAINPFVAGVYAGNPARLSVKQAFPKLHAIEQRYGSLILGQILGARERKKRGEVSKQNAKKFSFDEGLQVLTDTLRDALKGDVELESPVTVVEQTPEGWRITSLVQGREERRLHSAVLFASPAHKLAQIKLSAAHGLDLSPLEKVDYPPVTSIAMGFRRADVEHSCQGFGALVPEVEKLNVLGVIFSSALFPNRAPKGHVTLTSYVGGSRNRDLALADRGTIRRLALQDFKTLLGVKGEPTFEHYFTFKKAIPQYEVGYGQMKDLMNKIEANGPGLFLAGHYREGIALGDSIVSGNDVADRILNYIKQAKANQKVDQIIA
jgi:oxygen-dependent protoporphyrinogen oxidase